MFDNNYFGGYEADTLFTQADFWELEQEYISELDDNDEEDNDND